MNIYVGNLPYSMDDDGLRAAFEQHGTVTSARVIIDRESGRSRGFGFVEMSDDAEARNAITAMNQADVGGRQLKVNESQPRDRGGDRRPSRDRAPRW